MRPMPLAIIVTAALAVVLAGNACGDRQRSAPGRDAEQQTRDRATVAAEQLEEAAEKTGEALREAGRTGADAALTAAVKTALVADKTVKATAIDVDTVGRVVTLTGVVGSAQERSDAERIAGGVTGVLRVDNRLRVR